MSQKIEWTRQTLLILTWGFQECCQSLVSDPPWSRWHRSQVTSSNGDLPMDVMKNWSIPSRPVDSQRARHQIWQHFGILGVKISGVLCVTHFFVTSTGKVTNDPVTLEWLPTAPRRVRQQIWQHFWKSSVKSSGFDVLLNFSWHPRVSQHLTWWPWSGANGSTEVRHKIWQPFWKIWSKISRVWCVN